MIRNVKQFYKTHGELTRYGVMAVIVVGIEYGSYLLLLFAVPYLLAVPLSMLLGIILNWYFSRKFVFRNRRHDIHKEFALVLFASLLGVILQMFTAYIVVSKLGSTPAIGKLVAIIVTFFWNYFFRKKYVF